MENIQKYVDIWTINMSSRLRNVLIRNNISDLQQIRKYTKEDILLIRNMGIGTYQELESLCNMYNIKIWSLDMLAELFPSCKFPTKVYRNIFHRNITSIQDFANLAFIDILEIAGNNKSVTKKILSFLEQQNIEIKKEDAP